MNNSKPEENTIGIVEVRGFWTWQVQHMQEPGLLGSSSYLVLGVYYLAGRFSGRLRTRLSVITPFSMSFERPIQINPWTALDSSASNVWRRNAVIRSA